MHCRGTYHRRVARRRIAPYRPSRLSGGITTGIVLAVAVLWTLPTLGLFVSSVRPSENSAYSGWWTVLADHRVTWDNYREVLTGGDTLVEGIWPFFVNSIVIAIPVILMGLALASMTAYALVWIPFRGARVVLGLIVALQIVPVQMALLPLQQLFYLGWSVGPVTVIPKITDSTGRPLIAGTFASLWLAHTMFLLPFGIYLMHRSISQLPRPLFDAARVDGASHQQIFRNLALPLSVPAFASLAIFEFLWVWNDLLLASTFVTGDSDHAPITPYLADLSGSLVTQPALLSAGTFVAIALPLAVFFALQRYFSRGLLAGAIVE
jgi:alpha-glucoside transport system permease protein